ncbi:unnamed protein product [Prunus brigantina]
MGIPPVRAPRITKYLKPYVLKMHFTNKYVTAQVIHTPTATVASSASSQEKALRESMEIRRDVAAAGKIGKILGERLLLKNIPAVSVQLKREQKYHGKFEPGPMTFRSLLVLSPPSISHLLGSACHFDLIANYVLLDPPAKSPSTLWIRRTFQISLDPAYLFDL